MDLYSYITT